MSLTDRINDAIDGSIVTITIETALSRLFDDTPSLFSSSSIHFRSLIVVSITSSSVGFLFSIFSISFVYMFLKVGN